jgi:hypothetical protein
MKLFFALLCALPLTAQALAPADRLASTEFTFRANNPDRVMEITTAKLKEVFERYRPAVDSNTTIISPLQVTGSQTNPRIQMTAKKCVLFQCQTVKLDASITLREVSGSCRQNYVLNADLSRSGEILARNYDALSVNICYSSARANARVQGEAFALRASTYEGGIIANEILKMLALQIPPMSKAIRESLAANGGNRVRL